MNAQQIRVTGPELGTLYALDELGNARWDQPIAAALPSWTGSNGVEEDELEGIAVLGER